MERRPINRIGVDLGGDPMPEDRSGPEIVICTFRVRQESLARFRELLDGHWSTLRRLELVTDTPEQQFLSVDDGGAQPVVISIFEWTSDEASARAHDHPDVADIWEGMAPLCESRNGLPPMDFPHYRPLTVGG
ncbi:MAG: hypothetical protein ACR2QK_03860 [Acidimicrobiales bacterium]